MATELTAERLREQIDCDRVSGFTWRVSGNGGVAGERAGSPSSDGTLVISIDRVRYKAHKLAVLYVTGEWPKRVVRYLDGDRGNCAWDNLRESAGPKLTIKQRGGRGVYRERGAWRVEVIDGNGPTYRNGPFAKQPHAEADRLAIIKIRAALIADPKAAMAKERERSARWFRSKAYGHPTRPPYYVRVPPEPRPKEQSYYFNVDILGPYGSEEEAEAIRALPPEEIRQLAAQAALKLLDRVSPPQKSWVQQFEDERLRKLNHRPRICGWRDDGSGTPLKPPNPEIESEFLEEFDDCVWDRDDELEQLSRDLMRKERTK